MNSLLCRALILLSFFSVPGVVVAAETNRPTVVCFGDSITRAGYSTDLEALLPINAVNAGVSGNTSRQGLARIERDVISHKPSAVVVLFGTNDMREDAPRIRVGLAEYEKNILAIVERCRAAGAKVVLATIPPIDPKPYFKRHDKEKYDAAGGLAKLIAQYRDVVLRVGKTTSTPVVDLNHLLAGKEGWRKEDGVHPTAEGNRELARLLSGELEKILFHKKQAP